jgi:methionyl-tRNA formyltransferase
VRARASLRTARRRPPFPKNLRVVFFGTSEFALPALRTLGAHAEVRLVVTQPDRPGGRGQHLRPTPVKAAALEAGIAVFEPARLRDAVERLSEAQADLFVVASYGKIVPQAVLDLPPLGALNLHPSLLPLYRGATPLQNALRDGRRESGVTIILMDAGMDTGDVVLQERTPIGERETYGELHDRYAQLGARLLHTALDQVQAGTLVRTPQGDLGVRPEEIAATLTRPLGKEDLFVRWSWPARRVVDAVRSLSPQPLARATFAGESIKIVAAHVAEPGESDGAMVACGDGSKVVLETVVPPNRAPTSGAAYLRTRTPA